MMGEGGVPQDRPYIKTLLKNKQKKIKNFRLSWSEKIFMRNSDIIFQKTDSIWNIGYIHMYSGIFEKGDFLFP